jgi:hypothetical protein
MAFALRNSGPGISSVVFTSQGVTHIYGRVKTTSLRDVVLVGRIKKEHDPMLLNGPQLSLNNVLALNLCVCTEQLPI